MSKEYLVVLPVERFIYNRHFQRGEHLPLHVTVMHWFTPGEKLPFVTLSQGLRRIAEETKAFSFVSDVPALFGKDNTVPVHRIVENDSLRDLHRRLFAFLEAYNSLPLERQWVGDGYNPHVTSYSPPTQRGEPKVREFLPGTKALAEAIVLVERHKQTRVRVITNGYLFWGK